MNLKKTKLKRDVLLSVAVPFMLVVGFIQGNLNKGGKTTRNKVVESVEEVVNNDNSSIFDSIIDEDSWAGLQLKSLSLDEKIAQFFMIPAYSGKGETHLNEVEALVQNQKVGGIIWFQGNKENYLKAAKRMQDVASIPLLYGMDAEWGAAMRLDSLPKFPYAYTIGAANDLVLSQKIGEMMAQECRDMGIHISFGPVADVNSNPNNPVIGFRSFGENPEKVGNQVGTFVRAFEDNGVMSSIKHFPGHGDTDLDSHLELPVVKKSKVQIDAIDMFPFREGIRKGASSVMVGHLSVPSLDPSGTPSSLSSIIIKDYLQKELGFKGLVISDALNMKAVADRYGKTEVVVKAFEAGCDILLFPESVKEAIEAIKHKVLSGDIKMDEINARCYKVLQAKEQFIISPVKKVASHTDGEVELAKQQVYEKASVLLKNDANILPFTRLDKAIAVVTIGDNYESFLEMIDRYAPFDQFHFKDADLAYEDKLSQLKNYDVVITSINSSTVRSKNQFGAPSNLQKYLDVIRMQQEHVLVYFGNPLFISNIYDFTNTDALIVGYENNQSVQSVVAQQIMGAIPFKGALNTRITQNLTAGFGVQTKSNGRLKFTRPEELGIQPEKLLEIDSIVNESIKQHAFPGCQIVVAIEGKVIYRKSFGTYKYDKQKVVNNDVYDIASITKIAGSTMSVMSLESEDKFDLSKTLNDYIPEIVGGTRYANLTLKEILAHRAGLKSWIPFYTKTLTNGQLNMNIYSTVKKPGYTTLVEKDLYIMDSYADTMYQRILNTSLGSKKYVYSDLGYYFIKKIIEKQGGKPMEDFVQSIYQPMGLHYITYLPSERFNKDQIVPTEDDKIYRKRVVHGYVHDPGAAMIGGVGGHAGLFANATDLSAVMQMFLQDGYYGGLQYIQPEVVKRYSSVQYQGNRRGAGFDKPKTSGGGTCHELASAQSFGHSGFTGTLAWVDPKYDINYVFLSNRVYPDAENWKIVKMGIRTEIQRVIYEAYLASKK